MLKDKSCYANDRAYTRAYFLNKGIIKDYMIDPLSGTYIRTVYPAADQPQPEDKTMWATPKFMFMNRKEQSQMYDIETAEVFLKGLMGCDERGASRNEVYIGRHLQQVGGKHLRVTNFVVSFLTNGFDGSRMASLLSGCYDKPMANHPQSALLTAERHSVLWDNLLDALGRVSRNEDPVSDTLVIGKEMMTTFQHYDDTVRRGVVMTGRKFPDRAENYIILNSDNERFVIPSSEKISASGYINGFLSEVDTLTCMVDVKEDKAGAVHLLENTTNIDMEYVSARVVPFESGNKIRILLNSDKFPANTKFTYIYEAAKQKEFQDKMKSFCTAFDQL